MSRTHCYRELVRKKAVMAMHCFFLLSPDSVTHLEDDFRRSLSDKDPGVMEAALILFHDLILSDTAKYKDLTESFVMILQQVYIHTYMYNVCTLYIILYMYYVLYMEIHVYRIP